MRKTLWNKQNYYLEIFILTRVLFPTKFDTSGKLHRAIGKRYVSITYTFWGQKKIETDVCPRETFNDSCSTHVCKSVFHVFYTLGRNYTKNSNKMICIDVDRFCFWNLKKIYLKNGPCRIYIIYSNKMNSL